MERIIYRKTLDVHKSGVQFTLQGFETADKMSRTIELSLMASGDTIDLPLEKITAIMYVTTPNATEPSINKCTIKDNKIIYDVLPIVEEGITEMRVKLIETSLEGATSVLATPKFAIEVSESNTDDESATQTTTFTALEDAIAIAKGVYDERFLRMELDIDCMFRAYYADGTVYESDVLKELFHKGEALLSQSYARGGTGVRTGEDTDNSMYYSQVSKNASMEAYSYTEESKELLEETRKHGVYTAFSVDFETGEIKYISPQYSFNVNEETGELEATGLTYTPSETVEMVVTEWLNSNDTKITALENLAIESEEYPGCYYRIVNDTTEWINPPMAVGVEYQTTERFNGKPVYIKMVDCGKLEVKSIPHNIENMLDIVDFGGNWKISVSSGSVVYSIPYYYYNTTDSALCYMEVGITNSAVMIFSNERTMMEYSTEDTRVWIKYTKSTD